MFEVTLSVDENDLAGHFRWAFGAGDLGCLPEIFDLAIVPKVEALSVRDKL